jgi:hypothetical protein
VTAEIELEPVESVRMTILMDNVTDPLIPDQGPITRVIWPKALAAGAPRVPAAATGSSVPDALIAEPGFSALVRFEKAGRGAHAALRHGRLSERHGGERAPPGRLAR